MAKEFDGELISADSRQVYIGNDLETGKDKDLNTDNIKIWLFDIINQNDEFAVSHWKKLALEAIENILKRNKLPIVVGGSGLYIKALVQNLLYIDIPRDMSLRKSNKTASELFECLKKINKKRAELLNDSDRNNPRRLIRAIEIVQQVTKAASDKVTRKYIQIGLIASKEFLINKIKQRVKDRGLGEEYVGREVKIMKKQLVWFKKQPDIYWIDIAVDDTIDSCRKKLKSAIKL